MGGIVILVGIVAAYLADAASCSATSRRPGLACCSRRSALGASGSLDDFIKVRRRRSLGLSKTREDRRAGGRRGRVRRRWRCTSRHVSTELSFIRDTGSNLGVFFYVWVFLMLRVVVERA